MDGGTVPRWTDDELARLSPEEREDLVRRLVATGISPPVLPAGRRRRRFLLVAAVGSLVLVPWIGILAATLPHRYEARHWTLAWVGFDVALVVGLAATAWMAWRARPALVFPALVTATLLVCDAWFDTTTAQRSDVVVSALSAVLLELPMAAVLVGAVVIVLRSLVVLRSSGDGSRRGAAG
ncbi:hypothetical protein EV188_104432 [Actinomycetospora succinea]|uniref:Uncharacterized protein n=1 Tax=Actinomycetospora succinea TaxID=663603 RepID=A0A4R6VAJ3_9PSEU|nr:hypothetical protein [Actinomycetospora succinea]TDQ58685.1 hypothetical protein EV188_104432 [Actinomycetospora succinea]